MICKYIFFDERERERERERMRSGLRFEAFQSCIFSPAFVHFLCITFYTRFYTKCFFDLPDTVHAGLSFGLNELFARIAAATSGSHWLFKNIHGHSLPTPKTKSRLFSMVACCHIIWRAIIDTGNGSTLFFFPCMQFFRGTSCPAIRNKWTKSAKPAPKNTINLSSSVEPFCGHS